MGTWAHLIVVGAGDGAEAMLDAAVDRIESLERRWSRFIPTSELSRLNAAAGSPVLLEPDTYALVERAVTSWEATAGRFDPTVHDALVAAGYDRTFAEVAAGPRPVAASPPTVPGCAGIGLDPVLHAVTLPPGVHLDLGGIGKGWTVDLVVDQIMAGGAAGACANLGGDLRVAGEAPTEHGWTVAVEDPLDHDRTLATIALRHGAVATTTRTRRRWSPPGGGAQHHLIDPATGRPAATGLAAVTVVAADATTAEVVAKAAFVAGLVEGPALVEAAGAAALLVDDRGTTHPAGPIEEYLR